MDKKKNVNAMLIPAGCLIGLGVGMIYNQVAAGVLIGLGVGFLATFIASKIGKK
jgi:hypothetical protein